MPNSGNLFPGTAETVARTGFPTATAWPTLSNVLSDNATDSICASGSSGSQYLVCRNFGLALAVGDTVSGITFWVEASEHSGGTEVLNAQLQNDAGALIGTAKTVTLSGTSKTVYTYGGIADLWGATLTETIVNSANFGVRLWFTTSHDVRIDYVTAAVEYVLAPVTEEGGGVFPGPVFPEDVFPGEVFPGGEAGEVGAALTSVEATITVGTVVPFIGIDVTAALTGVSASIGFTIGGIGGPIFPSEIIPGPIFPGPIFPSAGEGGITDSGIGIVLPNTTKTLPAVLLSGTVDLVVTEGNIVATLSGVAVNATAGSLAVGDRSKALTGALANVSAGLVVKAGLLVLQGVSVQAGSISIGGASDPWGGSWGTSWGASWGTGGAEEGSSVGFVVANNAVGTSGANPTGTVSATEVSKLLSLVGVAVNAQAGFATGGSDKLANLTGVAATATAGVVITSVVGVDVAVSTGSLVSSRTSALTSVAAAATAGVLATDKTRALSGVSANATVGTLVFSPTSSLAGVDLIITASTLPQIQHSAFPQTPPATVAVGLLVPTKAIALSGIQTNATAGNLTITIVGLTGVEANAIAGFVTAGADRVANLIGVAVTAQSGTVSLGTSGLLVGVPAEATVGTVTQEGQIVTLSGAEANATAGTITAVPDREQTLAGVEIYGQGWYVTTGNDIVVLPLTSTVSSAAGAILEVQLISTLGGSGVTATGTVGTPGTTPDRQQPLTGVAVNVAAGVIQRESVTLTGVGVDVAAGNVDNNVQKTLAAVRVNAGIGFIVPAGDVLASLTGVAVNVEVGTVGVIPAMPTGTYRHVAPGPARNGRIKDLEELEREMALMEE